MSVSYKLDGDAVVRVEGDSEQTLAHYSAESKTLDIADGCGKFKTRLVRELKNMGHSVDVIGMAGEQIEAGEVKPVVSETETVSTPVEHASTEVEKPSGYELPLPRRKEGDKTEGIVQTLHDQDFDEFCRRYKVIDRKKGADGLYPAYRKTHLTRKVATNNQGGQYAD